MKTFIVDFEVYFEDISPAGKIHLEKLAEWLSMAREKYFKTLCPNYNKFLDGSIKMFTTNISLSIKGRAKWADKIVVTLTSSNVKKISFEINADFTNTRTGEMLATGVQKVIFMNTTTSKFSCIPDDLKNNVIQYQQ